MRSLTTTSAGVEIKIPPVLPTTTHVPHVNDHPPQHHNSRQSRHLPRHPPNLLLQHPRPSLLAKPPSLPGRPSHIFSKKTLDLIEHAIGNSWAPSTISRYSQAVHEFTCFCVKEKVPHNLRFPADEFVLCAYAASCVGLNGKTVQKRFSGLKAWHHAHNADWQGGMRLRIVINGVSNLAPPSSTQPPRPPINSTMLSQLITSLNLNDPFDAVVAVCACIAFWGQCRLGELLASSSSDFSTTTRPARSHIGPSKRNATSYTLFLPRTKTHRHGDNVVLVNQDGVYNPLSILRHHLTLNDLPNESPLFTFTTPAGPRVLTRYCFLARCNEIWSTFGYPHTTGHSFRIGGTTHLLLAGIPPDVVKVMGRWSSDAFLRYWRHIEDIVPLYATDSKLRKARQRRKNTRRNST
jgi:hypothetical protein